MKKLLVFFVCVLFSSGLFAQINGSAHDFEATGWAGGEICLPCHTPHNAKTGADNLVPLWNHGVTATDPFTLYSSPTGTLDATDLDQPAGVSKACLSCHDGTVALDTYGTATGSTMIAAGRNLGTNLSNDHPVSFTYDDPLASTDGELHVPSTTNVPALGGSIQNTMLFTNQMECGSCHDVHNTPGNATLLRIDNAGSALCLTCHDK